MVQKLLFSAEETGTKFKINEKGEVDGETSDSDMQLDADQQALSLAFIAAKEAEDIKELEDCPLTAAADKAKQVKVEPKETASGHDEKPPGMEPPTPTLQTDRRTNTSQSASSSSKSLTANNP